MSTGTATKAAEKPRLKTLEEMTPEEREAFEKKTPAQQEEYKAKLLVQEAQDRLAESRAKAAQEREARKAEREKERQIKEIIREVREGKLEATPEALTPKFQAMTPQLPEDQYEATIKRIKEDSVSKSKSGSIPAKPAYELTHELKTLKRADFVGIGASTPPDSTLSNSVRRYGQIAPVLARVSPDDPTKYILMDGKRRVALAGEEDAIPTVIVAGFPDEDTAERAEVTVNRVRSLNVLAVATMLTRMRTRGIEDTVIRRDMGFKTGEIDKLTSVITNLDPALNEGLMAGNITPSVALAIAKLPKALQKELAKTYGERLKANPSLARISEADVEGVRQKRAAEAAKRDTPTLAGLAGSVDENDAKGGKVDKGKGAKVSSSKSAPVKGK